VRESPVVSTECDSSCTPLSDCNERPSNELNQFQVHLGSAHGFKQRHNESAVEDEVPVYNVHNADLHKNISFNASPKGVQAAQRQEDGNLDTELERATNNAGLLSEGPLLRKNSSMEVHLGHRPSGLLENDVLDSCAKQHAALDTLCPEPPSATSCQDRYTKSGNLQSSQYPCEIRDLAALVSLMQDKLDHMAQANGNLTKVVQEQAAKLVLLETRVRFLENSSEAAHSKTDQRNTAANICSHMPSQTSIHPRFNKTKFSYISATETRKSAADGEHSPLWNEHSFEQALNLTPTSAISMLSSQGRPSHLNPKDPALVSHANNDTSAQPLPSWQWYAHRSGMVADAWNMAEKHQQYHDKVALGMSLDDLPSSQQISASKNAHSIGRTQEFTETKSLLGGDSYFVPISVKQGPSNVTVDGQNTEYGASADLDSKIEVEASSAPASRIIASDLQSFIEGVSGRYAETMALLDQPTMPAFI